MNFALFSQYEVSKKTTEKKKKIVKSVENINIDVIPQLYVE
jgi:hypothetical protein